MTRFSLSILAILFASYFAHGQVAQFQAPSLRSALEQTEYAPDPTTPAAFQYDITESRFLTNSGGFEINTKRSLRIKIYRAQGTDYGTVSIPYYRSGSAMEIKNIRGATYNLSENNEIDYEALTDINISNVRQYDRFHELVITFPKVKAGSVLELSYEIRSTRLDLLPNFLVQANIPKAYARYYTEIPSLVNYNLIRRGKINYSRYHMEILDRIGRIGNYTYQQVSVDIEAKNIPAFGREAYMPAESMARGAVDFQFVSLNLPDFTKITEVGSWEGFNDWLVKHDAWVGYLRKERLVQKRMPTHLQQAQGLDGAMAIFEWVQQLYTWDGYGGLFPDHNARSFDGTQPGNQVDINLTLNAALNAAEFESYPIIGSTFQRGRFNPEGPILEQMDNVMVLVIINGQEYYLDAANRSLPFGTLSLNDYNGLAWVVDSQNPRLVSMYENQKANWKYEGRISWNEETETFQSEWELSQMGIAKGFEFTKEWVEENWNLESIQWGSISKSQHPDSLTTTTFTGIYPAERIGEQFLVPLMMDQRLLSYPFANEDRFYLMDFRYPHQQNYSITLELPDGYQVEALPSAVSQALPGANALFFFSTKQDEERVVIQASLRLKQAVYPTSQYSAMRDLFQAMDNALNQSLVLVKETP